MAQSTVVEPSLRQVETPIQAPTSAVTTYLTPITSPRCTLSSALTTVDISSSLNPVLEIPPPGPAVTPAHDPSTLHLNIPSPHGDTIVAKEDGIWREMAETFEDLYQGLATEDISKPIEMNSTIVHNSPDDNDAKPEDTAKVKFQNLFAKPFHNGFHRMVRVDEQNNCTISYIAPDKTTWIHSFEAMEQFLRKNPTPDVLTSDFCWANLILGFEEPTWETVDIIDQRQRHSRTPSGLPSASSSESAPDNQTAHSACTDKELHEQPGDNAKNPTQVQTRYPLPQFPRPDRLDNTLKPNGPLLRDMSITEADTWLKKFTAWFEWNAPILDTKHPTMRRAILENFLDDRLISKLQTDTTITTDTPILGSDGIINKLRSYYNDNPIFYRRHAFTACKQETGEPFLTWWERKMKKAQEAMIAAMTTENWLELELIQGINDPNLRKRILQECNPKLQDMVCIAKRWQSAEDATTQFTADTESSETDSEKNEASDEIHNWNKGPVISTNDYARNPKEREEDMNGNQKSKSDTLPTNTPTDDNDVHNRTTKKPLDLGPRMRNVRITPVTDNCRHDFLQFNSDVYPDTSCMETVIARNTAERQKMSVTPTARLPRVNRRRCRDLTTFDIEYDGRTIRVEALLSASLEDGIFLGWNALKKWINGINYGPTHYGNPNPTTEPRYDVLGPETSHNHTKATRLEGLQWRPEHRAYKPNKPCAGCGDELSPHGRMDCPNRGKRCYNCNKIGHVQEVCRQRIITAKNEYQTDTSRERILTDLTYQLRDPVWKAENDQKLVELTHQLRDAIWKAKSTADYPDGRAQDARPVSINPQPNNTSATLNIDGHTEDTTDPREGASGLRPAKHYTPTYRTTYLNKPPSDAFLIPFQCGFHREVVKSANGKTLRTYYYTENGTPMRNKKDVDPHIEHLHGITRDDFDFSGTVLPLDDPTKRYQSIRLDQRTLPNN